MELGQNFVIRCESDCGSQYVLVYNMDSLFTQGNARMVSRNVMLVQYVYLTSSPGQLNG